MRLLAMKEQRDAERRETTVSEADLELNRRARLAVETILGANGTEKKPLPVSGYPLLFRSILAD